MNRKKLFAIAAALVLFAGVGVSEAVAQPFMYPYAPGVYRPAYRGYYRRPYRAAYRGYNRPYRYGAYRW